MTREQAIKLTCRDKDTQTQNLAFMLNNPRMKDDVKRGAEEELKSRGISEASLGKLRGEK